MNAARSPASRFVRHIGMAVMLSALWQPAGAVAQGSPGSGSTRAIQLEGFYPELQKAREIGLAGLGVGLVTAGILLPVDYVDVPLQGLDPGEIAWGVDRDVISNRSSRADVTSDWTRNAALAFPFVLALVTAAPGERWGGFGQRTAVYAETILLSQGSTLLGKAAFGRPRPFAYRSVDQREGTAANDISRERTFRSMPSGHSSSAWTGAAIGMTEHLLLRPEASWVERAGVGFVAGALAGTTSALRVAAGQHFPSDVLAGAGIGVVTGVTVPLLHRGQQPLPGARAWMEMGAGALGGTLVGILVAHAF